MLTVSSQGKTRTIYLGAKRLADARRMAGNYRRLKVLLEEVSELNLVLLTGRERAKERRVKR